MDTKYYKITSKINEDFGGYTMKPMYDEYPDLGSFEMSMPSPKCGDYIIVDENRAWAISVYDYDISDADYKIFNTPEKIKAFVIRNKNNLMEVSKRILNKDLEISCEIINTEHEIINWIGYIYDLDNQSLFKKIFRGGNKELREAKSSLSKAEKRLLTLTEEHKKLMAEC